MQLSAIMVRNTRPDPLASMTSMLDGSPVSSSARMRRTAAPGLLEAGVYGLSNAGLDTPWPKLVKARSGL
ncbi:MAG: hypothetical protein E2602_07470, partial [Achromobacter sp.]|nr:hypothetical protein [Achromobacter sp.]